MGDNLTEDVESQPHEFTEEHLKNDTLLTKEPSEKQDIHSTKQEGTGSGTYLSLKKESCSVKDLDPINDTDKYADSYSQNKISLPKDRNSLKDLLTYSVPDKKPNSVTKLEVSTSLKSATSESFPNKKSYSIKKSEPSTSLKSATSESIPVKKLDSIKKSELSNSLRSATNTSESFIALKKPSLDRKLTDESLPSKYKKVDVSASCSQNKNIFSQKVSPENSGSLDMSSKTSFKVAHSGKESKNPSDHTNVTYNTKESSSNYVSPWAKSLTSCKPTMSQSSTKADNMKEYNYKCIPPWAKTLRKLYGMPCTDSNEDFSQKNLQEKIKNLMDKHSRLMLIKRGESRKQLILKPSECGQMGTVKMASKNTRYYMTPISRELEESILENDLVPTSSEDKISASQGSEVMAMTKKTSKSQAKTEVSKVLKSLYNSKIPKEIEKNEQKLKNQQTKCLKITPSKIREFVNVQTQGSDAQKLHEIIKIKKVPSYGFQVGRKPSSKYIINIPKNSKGDETTVNKITVKEKRRIRIDSVEDINENITEIVYNKHDLKTQEQVKDRYTAEESVEHDVVPYSKRRKSPTKTKTLEVTTEKTPIVSDFLKKEEKDRDKILLIQYEKKSKPCKEKSEPGKTALVSTQLLGIRQPCNETLKEMYLYGTETDGKTCKERITQVDDVSPTLREKVNMIFQELREMTFKPCEEIEEAKGLRPSVSSKTFQHPSLLVERDAVSVQALPEVRSAEVQVHESVLFSMAQSEVTQLSPTSYLEEDKKESIEEQVNILPAASSNLSIETSPTTKSQLNSEQLMGAIPIEESGIEEEQIAGPDTDEIQLFESDEKVASKESQHLIEGIEMQEKTHSEGTQDESLNIDEKETNQSRPSEEITQDDDQGDIGQDGYEEEQYLEVEHSVEENIEEFGYEGSLFEKEGTDSAYSKDKLLKDDGHLIEENVGSIDQKEEEMGEEHLLKKDSTEEEIASDKISDQLKAGDEKIHMFMEDIRSYDFDPAQDYELKMISSSKFFHQRDSLRKMNWTEDILYLEKNTCPQLIRGLAEIAVKQPEDPISYLAHWIYKNHQNHESDEQNSVFKEHLEVAKAMLTTKKDDKPVCKKFSLRRYPLKNYSSVVSTASETSHIEDTETEL